MRDRHSASARACRHPGMNLEIGDLDLAVDRTETEPAAPQRLRVHPIEHHLTVADELDVTVRPGDKGDAVGMIGHEQEFRGGEVVLREERAGAGAVITSKAGCRVEVFLEFQTEFRS